MLYSVYASIMSKSSKTTCIGMYWHWHVLMFNATKVSSSVDLINSCCHNDERRTFENCTEISI